MQKGTDREMTESKKKKCYVCRKQKPLKQFSGNGKGIACEECRKKFKPAQYFGI